MNVLANVRYHPSPDQVALAASLRESLSSILPLSRLREAHEENAETWKALRALGVFGVSVPEADGGSGLGATDEALIVIELGRRVVTASVLATVGAAAMRWPASSERRVAAGYRRGDRIVFVEDSSANQLLIRGESGAGLFEYPTSSRLLDDKLWSSRLRERDGLGEALLETDRDQALRLRLIDAAALAGLAQAALEMAVGYAGMREQFGRAIGSFQAVKHHCANMALASRLAGDQVSFAALAVDDARDDAVLQVESAFFVAGTAALDNAGKNIQIHGGIGFSDEADPQRLLKRARLLIEIAGGLEAAVTRVGALRSEHSSGVENMAAPTDTSLPSFDTVLLARSGRLLTITLNRPDTLNAVDQQMHEDLVDVLAFVANDEHSDVIVLTGAGRAFSAGGDLAYLAETAAHPERFDADVVRAKRIVYAILDLEKPLICRMQGHAVGLGATLALLCDVVFAADTAKIGDPHVNLGLVAGDGGALVWPQRVGLARAKEYLMTGDLLSAKKAEEIGLVNHCLPAAELDGAVNAFCQRLLSGSTQAIRWTKVLLNLEQKRIAHAVMDPGIAYEAVTVRSSDYRDAVDALQHKRTPVFRKA